MIEIPSTPSSTTPILEREGYWQKKWKRNQGLALILLSELFGACMITSARLLQNGTAERPGNMLTLQIIFVRFSLTFVFSMLYMWYTKVADFPWGKPEIRWLLVLRGLAGFWGVVWILFEVCKSEFDSVKYLPIAEAIVLGFFTPLLTAYSCHLILGTAFTRHHFISGVLCLLGVILIAQPTSLLPGKDSLSTPQNSISYGNQTSLDNSGQTNDRPEIEVTTQKRLLAILLGVSSCIGSASVYTLIRLIGPKTHALISVNYYALLSTIISFLLLLFLPPQFSNPDNANSYLSNFQFPSDLREWLLLLSLGIYGFLLQFLMTRGLQLEKGVRGTNMMYVQIVFALGLDWGVWGVWPGGWSWVGGGVVVGSTVWVAMQKDEDDAEKVREGMRGRDEEVGFIGHGNDSDDDTSDGDEVGMVIEMKESK